MELDHTQSAGNRAIDVEPGPLTCPCGRIWRWEIWPGHTAPARFRHHAPRWAAPSVDPCPDCQEAHEMAQEARRLERAQKHAGIGHRDRAWTWDRTLVQAPNEEIDRFQDRVSWEIEPTIGVLRRNIDAARAVAAWTPDAGHSIYLMGGVGTGKTLFSAALGNRLLQAAPMARGRHLPSELTAPAPKGYGLSPEAARKRIEMGRDLFFQAAPSWSAAMIPENELYERVKLGWQRDRAPLAKIADVDGLILDDLGEVGHDPHIGDRAGKPQPPGSQEGIQRLIRYRYASSKHLVITSNIPFRAIRDGATIRRSGILERYGARVFDRLCEMCGDHVYSLGGDSWRAR